MFFGVKTRFSTPSGATEKGVSGYSAGRLILEDVSYPGLHALSAANLRFLPPLVSLPREQTRRLRHMTYLSQDGEQISSWW